MATSAREFAAGLAADIEASRPACEVRWDGEPPCGHPGGPVRISCSADADDNNRLTACPACAETLRHAACFTCFKAGRSGVRLLVESEVG